MRIDPNRSADGGSVSGQRLREAARVRLRAGPAGGGDFNGTARVRTSDTLLHRDITPRTNIHGPGWRKWTLRDIVDYELPRLCIAGSRGGPATLLRSLLSINRNTIEAGPRRNRRARKLRDTDSLRTSTTSSIWWTVC